MSGPFTHDEAEKCVRVARLLYLVWNEIGFDPELDDPEDIELQEQVLARVQEILGPKLVERFEVWGAEAGLDR